MCVCSRVFPFYIYWFIHIYLLSLNLCIIFSIPQLKFVPSSVRGCDMASSKDGLNLPNGLRAIPPRKRRIPSREELDAEAALYSDKPYVSKKDRKDRKFREKAENWHMTRSDIEVTMFFASERLLTNGGTCAQTLLPQILFLSFGHLRVFFIGGHLGSQQR